MRRHSGTVQAVGGQIVSVRQHPPSYLRVLRVHRRDTPLDIQDTPATYSTIYWLLLRFSLIISLPRNIVPRTSSLFSLYMPQAGDSTILSLGKPDTPVTPQALYLCLLRLLARVYFHFVIHHSTPGATTPAHAYQGITCLFGRGKSFSQSDQV